MKKILFTLMFVSCACFGEPTPKPTPTPSVGHFTGKHEKAYGPDGNYLIWSEYRLPDGTRVWIVSEIGSRL